MKNNIVLMLVLLAFTACNKDVIVETPEELIVVEVEEGEELPGGKLNTVLDTSPNAFSFPSPALKKNDKLSFFTGNSFFKQNWVAAPASTKARDGLGPTFNARSCASCHFKDGRGSPEFAGEFTTGLLLRLSVPGTDAHGGPKGDAVYGGQLNEHGISGVKGEGTIKVSYKEVEGQFPDGEKYSLREPEYSIGNPEFGEISKGIMISPRVGQQVIGMGLLEAIKEKDILKKVDLDDKDKDGISGKANMVWDAVNKKKALGRFGWKANQPSLRQQTAGAFLGDLGITTSLFSGQNCPDVQKGCCDAPEDGTPELDDTKLDRTVLYITNLAVPARRDHKDATVLKGKKIFNEINCSSCHTPKYTTGKHPRFDNLSNQKIWPYTDLLVHDMGDALADNRPDFEATGNEWRTPPLWGIGLFQTVNRHTFLLHDGRARNVQEAILWHGGESEESKKEFMKLSKEDRQAVLKFLNSLQET